jgi:hypothetical protein
MNVNRKEIPMTSWDTQQHPEELIDPIKDDPVLDPCNRDGTCRICGGKFRVTYKPDQTIDEVKCKSCGITAKLKTGE